MSMEIIFIIAAATGRTLVLPPKRPLYLLHHTKKGESRHRGFADFYPIQTAEFQKRVKVISMEEFIQREGTGPNARFPVPEEKKAHVLKAAVQCDNKPQEDEDGSCDALYEYLSEIGSVPNISAADDCLVFDDRAFNNDEPSGETKEYIATHCGKRRAVYWGATDKDTLSHESAVIHINAAVRQTRLLAHFYSFVFFTDPAIDNYYKRFVRDFLHYHDTIYCAAGKIVKALQAEAASRGFQVDASGAGGYASMHVRRGELQYKRVKIPAQEWYENTKEVWLPKEILYVATDERNKTFFDEIAAHHDLRFLDDYWEYAGLGDLDGNYMGMIDTIVASRGRAFAGTWFSTFSGFINRMRGYHGMSMMDSWYSFLEKKEGVHQWVVIDDARFAFEWPDGWIGIDADVWPSKDKF
jgi:GDP-fucose protein O-fucosyltransferase